MQNRLKQIRKSDPNGKSQQSFADFLGISLSNLASYESGRRKPSDAVISLISEKTGYNVKWIETGEGEPKIPKSREEEIAEVVSRMYKLDENSLQYKTLMKLGTLSADQWAIVQQALDILHAK